MGTNEYKTVVADAVVEGFRVDGIDVCGLCELSLAQLDVVYGAIAPCKEQRSLKKGGAISNAQSRGLKIIEAIYRLKEAHAEAFATDAKRALVVEELKDLILEKKTAELKKQPIEELEKMLAGVGEDSSKLDELVSLLG
jgi:hypothetical protein